MEDIKKTVKELFRSLGLDDIGVDIKKDNSLKDKELLVISIKMEPKESKRFLEEGNAGLSALQHLIRILISRKNVNHPFLLLDINNYRKKREKDLDELVTKAITKVRKTKKAITFEPMSAYERRLIHLKLAEEPDLVTESIGEEPERKVVVRPYP